MLRQRLLGLLAAIIVFALSADLASAQVVKVPTFRVGTASFADFLQESDVAVGADGNITFIWWEFHWNNNRDYVVTRQFSPDGVALGPAVRVDASGRAARPAISADDRGGYVAVWDRQVDGYAIYGRHLDAAGRGTGIEFLVDDDGGVGTAVAALPSGSVFSWKDYYLMGRMLDVSGNPRAASFQIGEQSPCFWNSLDALSDGGFVDVWANPWRMPISWAHIFGPDGASRGDPVPVSEVFLADRVAGSPLGGFAVVGNGACEGSSGLWLRRFHADGSPVDAAEILVATSAAKQDWITEDVAYDPDGNIFVVWNDYDMDLGRYSGLFARAYDTSGEPLGPKVEIATQTGVGARTARMADGCFANTWYERSVVYGNVVCLCNRSGVVCGDGEATDGCEACDDANTIDGDGCDSNCTTTGCGNGVVTAGETCDDGNAADGDGCDSNCRATGCGNGAVSDGEECDDGNTADDDGCDHACHTDCGNLAVGPGEQCDDGNRIDGDGCDANCTTTRCGNAVVTAGEQCDDGNAQSGDGCDINCTDTGCGNAVRTEEEECDDGARANGDGCDSACLVELCGNARLEGSEECDDGDQIDDNGCRSNCRLSAVHDSVVLPVDPVTIQLPAGQEPTVRHFKVQVLNADVEPDRERPGHTIELIVNDGDCPAGTVVGSADFDPGIDGDQNTVLAAAGEPRLAHVVISLSRADFAPVTQRAPQRCALELRVRADVEGSFDPTPSNNSVGVELNVADTLDPVASSIEEFVLTSLKPVEIRIPPGTSLVRQTIKPKTYNADTGEEVDTGKVITVTGLDGDCPAGTIGLGDFDRRLAGTQNTFRLARNKRARGSVGLSISSDAFASPSRYAPARCTVFVTATSGVLEDTDATNNSTRLVIDVIDHNDY